MTETESEYPHWKEALFGNGKVANLWCAVKYGIWHGAHLLLAVLGVLLFVLVKAYRGLKRVLGYVTPDSAPTVPTPNIGLKEKLTSERASDAGIVAFLLICIGWFGWLAYEVIVYALANTITFLAIVGGITLGIIALIIGIVGVLLIEKHFGVKERSKKTVKVTGVKTAEKAGAVKEKSKETPLFRRILGYCPVSMSMEPKWFNSFAEKLEKSA